MAWLHVAMNAPLRLRFDLYFLIVMAELLAAHARRKYCFVRHSRPLCYSLRSRTGTLSSLGMNGLDIYSDYMYSFIWKARVVSF